MPEDPTLARIPLAAIMVDPTVQQRAAGTSQSVVDDYAEAMRNGIEFPPIDVVGDGDGPFHLGDGFHRLEAHLLVFPDAELIECRVHPGNRDDAIFFACAANTRHGLPRSRADKLKAVTTLLSSEKCSGWSDREIARQCAVSHTFVSGVRSQHLATLPDADAEQVAPATPAAPSTAAPVRRRTASRGGRRYKLNTAGIGRNRSQPEDEVAKLKRELESLQRALSGASEPARRMFIEHYREAIMALAHAPDPPDPQTPNPKPPNEAPTPDAPEPEDVESSTDPPPRARAFGGGKTSRFTRGSAPNKSQKNAAGRHLFDSDNQPKAKRGRPPGSLNKFTRDLREAIMEAAERLGGDGQGEDGVVGYLMWLGQAVPASFSMLMRAGMPAEIRAILTLKPVLTLEEAMAELRARGLPTEFIENLTKVDEELGPDDEPAPYDDKLIDLEPDPSPAAAV